MPHVTAEQHLRTLSAGLGDRGIGVLLQDADFRFLIVEGLPPLWPEGSLVGRVPAQALPSGLAAGFERARNALAPGTDFHAFEFDLGSGTERRTYEAHMRRLDSTYLTTVIDITEARQRELAVAALLREVSHRSKNLLAIVQSVAMQTAINTPSTSEFLDRFRGRLHALSSTQDLVTESDWRGTYLHSLVAAQLTRVAPSMLSHLRLTGINPLLGPNAALHVGLAIHELAANAVRHGGMGSGGAGHVWVDARLDGGAARPDLVIEWQETGIPRPAGPSRPRFGTLVLERIVPVSVGGQASLGIADDAVRYHLAIPADQYDV